MNQMNINNSTEANVLAMFHMGPRVTVDLYADDFASENLPAEFEETGEWVSDDAVNGGREYWEATCTLTWVAFGRKRMNRAEVVEIVGEDFVAELEVERAEATQ